MKEEGRSGQDGVEAAAASAVSHKVIWLPLLRNVPVAEAATATATATAAAVVVVAAVVARLPFLISSAIYCYL